MIDSTDQALLRQYVATQSEAAFTSLVRRHMDLVYSAALRQSQGNGPHAEDIVQQVFTLLARKASSLTSHPSLTGWLYLTATHASRRAIRSEWRRMARNRAAFAMTSPLGSETPAAWEQTRPILDAAMRDLAPADQNALLQRYFVKKTFPELGKELEISEDGARRRVERALAKLHGLLLKRGITSSASALALCLETQAVTPAPAALSSRIVTAVIHGPVSIGPLHFMHLSTFTAVLAVATVAATGLYLRETTVSATQRKEITHLQNQAVMKDQALASLQNENKRLADLASAAKASLSSVKLAAAPGARRSAAKNKMDVQNLTIKSGNLKSAFAAYELYSGHRVVIDPAFERIYRVITLHAGPCSRAEAAKVISDELLKQDHIALDLWTDGTAHARLVQ